MATVLSDVTLPESPSGIARRLGRWNIDLPVRLEARDGSSAAVLRNMSTCGMFVATSRVFDIGGEVRVRVVPANDAPPVEIRAEIRWVRAASDGVERPAGIGLRFTEPLWEVVTFVGTVLRRRRGPWT
jgi:Tfp pilus assembly protein PilZ